MGVFGRARCFASIAEILSFNCATRDLRYSSSSDTPIITEKSGRRDGELNETYRSKCGPQVEPEFVGVCKWVR